MLRARAGGARRSARHPAAAPRAAARADGRSPRTPGRHTRRAAARPPRGRRIVVLGFAASGHPLSLLRGALPPGVVQSDALPRLEHGAWVEVAGLVVARQRPETAKGFIFV